MKKVKIKAEIINANIRQSTFDFEVKIDNMETSQDIIIQYISENDGGPLMRPKNPPR